MRLLFLVLSEEFLSFCSFFLSSIATRMVSYFVLCIFQDFFTFFIVIEPTKITDTNSILKFTSTTTTSYSMYAAISSSSKRTISTASPDSSASLLDTDAIYSKHKTEILCIIMVNDTMLELRENALNLCFHVFHRFVELHLFGIWHHHLGSGSNPKVSWLSVSHRSVIRNFQLCISLPWVLKNNFQMRKLDRSYIILLKCYSFPCPSWYLLHMNHHNYFGVLLWKCFAIFISWYMYQQGYISSIP